MKELDASDATEIAARMREADPEYWGQATSEQIADGMSKGANWFGIKVNEELVSIGMSRVTQWAGLIGVVATQEECRKRGYATSIVSELTRQILKERSLAM
ncbi:MAG: hypothetical protein GWN86_29265, partial [Desulfobacterales bacterium]|nr:hypothetical protein [Desulfobacterales bacterium]